MNSNETIRVIELRNYLLKPGARERFIDYFRRRFVESQNARGGFVLGGFRLENAPDRFFWIRGFNDMRARSRFLPAFYGGEVWKRFGREANEMMLEWHDVHLLRPFGTVKIGDFLTKKSSTLIDFRFAEDKKLAELIDLAIFENQTNATFWVSETAENDFPRLPVIQDRNLLASIIHSDDHVETEDAGKGAIQGSLIKRHERLILSRAF